MKVTDFFPRTKISTFTVFQNISELKFKKMPILYTSILLKIVYLYGKNNIQYLIFMKITIIIVILFINSLQVPQPTDPGGKTWGENLTKYGGIGNLPFNGKTRVCDLLVSRNQKHFSSGLSR